MRGALLNHRIDGAARVSTGSTDETAALGLDGHDRPEGEAG
jgi:hypothetical protein